MSRMLIHTSVQSNALEETENRRVHGRHKTKGIAMDPKALI